MSDNRNRMSRRRRQVKTYTSNGPEVMIRGQACQIAEKYINLAKEGMEVEKQNLLQHADHWNRQSMLDAETPRP